MKTFWRLAVALSLIAAGVFVFWPLLSGSMDSKPKSSESRREARGGAGGPPPSILFAEAKLADVPVYIDAVGTARPLNTVAVRPQVDGQIVEINFKEGQDVKKGDLIARIDSRLLQAQLEQVNANKAQHEAQLANARLDLDRFTKLLVTNAASHQQVDTQNANVRQFEAQLKADQALIDSATTTLSYTQILAPIDGRTGLRNVDVGNLVRAGDSTGIVTISQIRPVAVLFNVPQQQLNAIIDASVKGPLQVEAVDGQGKSVTDRGTLEVIDNQVDQLTGTVRLKAQFPNAELRIWPGSFVNVRLLVNTLRQSVVVPSGALQRGPKGAFVYVVQPDDTVAMRPVSTSQQDDVQAVITSGLASGDRVVTTGFARLSDGIRVAVAADDSAPAEQAAPEIHQNSGAAPPMGGGDKPRGERRKRSEAR